ncbi:MAG: LLM class F420-dependent oxidoreductase [Gammaproteobacteria bacterium]|jgi:F420-dependent oxidoreductase-like protein|nr:LLM class F420-dependent oxidoreductase [Gammaproteobacteria bacterium]MDA8627695.1 LLM class F420-dependent oxidoreductase [Pseudomonadales bacterium]MBT6791754.1 LLM class F420-dependent oxidoreductase [Gammaproteobacteria bacterium]MBT7389157.1 LLM class F420-dependent oxidoreductase [Gammaproteobacteria bacterium]MBT7885133.1 LLM class F420-dependent oxidoreductase [Gammaproteobacteria bacterium]
MKVAIGIGSAYYNGDDWNELVDYTVAADTMGVDYVWSAEAWGMDAVVPLAYLAAKTQHIKLGTGIMQISSRVPPMIAMTAQSLRTVSNNRFVLGLGVSGPQVVEGLHGASFAKPLSRLRECVDIIKLGLASERIAYEGKHYVLPRPGGEGKPIRLSQPPQADLPIYLATLGPKAMEMTGELANGWLGTSFMPEQADIFLEPLLRGLAKSGRTLADIDVQVGGSLEIDDDVERLIEARRPAMAFTLGGMGSAKTNFYNDAFKRAGYAEAAEEVQALWVSGDKEAAIRAVPDEMVLKTNLIGTREMIVERIKAYAAAGVTTLRISTSGRNWRERTETLAEATDLIHSIQ